MEEIGECVPGEAVVDAVADSSRRLAVGTTKNHLFTVDIESPKIRVVGEVPGAGRLAVASGGGIVGRDGDGHLWLFDPATGDLKRRAVPLPRAGSPYGAPGARREMLPEGSRWVGAVAVWIKRRVRAETGLYVSVGVGANKLVAKAASDFGKPSGVTLVEAGREGAFLGLLELKDIPGVGPSVREKFARWNVHSVAEALRLPVDLLQDAFGPERGQSLYGLLRGMPGEPVEVRAPDRPKSISRETTFWTASNDYEFVEAMLFYLTERLGRALRREGMEGRTVQVKVRYSDFETVQRSRSMGEHVDRDEAVFATARELLKTQWCRSRRVRLVGVGLADLRPVRVFQDSLFDTGAERSRRIDRCLDGLRERFGFGVVQRGPAIRLAEGKEEAAEMPDISAMVRR